MGHYQEQVAAYLIPTVTVADSRGIPFGFMA